LPCITSLGPRRFPGYANWCPEWGSNPHWEDFKSSLSQDPEMPAHGNFKTRPTLWNRASPRD